MLLAQPRGGGQQVGELAAGGGNAEREIIGEILQVHVRSARFGSPHLIDE